MQSLFSGNPVNYLRFEKVFGETAAFMCHPRLRKFSFATTKK